MGETEARGTVTSLSSMFPPEEAQKAAKRVEEAISEKQNELNQLRGFIADNTSLINLVQKLPDELHHDIMVPFGKAAFFPGRMIHTNEFLVLLGENYFTERTAKQTVDILKRRGKSLESKVDSLKAVMQDLKAEASFFDATASEVAEGLVEIREEYEEDHSDESVSQSGPLEQVSPNFSEADAPNLVKKYNTVGALGDDEYARIMSRLDELEKEELAAESYEEVDEDQHDNAVESESDEDEQIKAVFDREKDEDHSSLDHNERHLEVYQSRKPVHPSKGKDLMSDKISNESYNQDLKNPLACTGLSIEPITRGEISHSQSVPQDTKKLNPSNGASVPSEKKVRFQVEDSPRSEKSVQTSKSGFDGSKAFTGSIVEHAHNLENLTGQTTSSSQHSSSQPSKPVSRFKMQRKPS